MECEVTLPELGEDAGDAAEVSFWSSGNVTSHSIIRSPF